MRSSTKDHCSLQIALLGLIVLTLLVGCNKAKATGQRVSGDAPSQLAQDMIGTWVHVGRPGRVTEAPAVGGRFKLRTGTHWAVTHPEADTGLVTEHFGGTYALDGDEYIETQDYADSTWLKDNGKSFKFRVKVEGDTMTQVGIDNPYTEVWKRVR